MPIPSEESPERVSLNLHFRRHCDSGGVYDLGVDGWAKAAVIDKIIRLTLAEWPDVVYHDQIHKLVRDLCNPKKTK